MNSATESCLRVLALEPYYGGSHRAFLDGWSARSRHAFTVLSLEPRKWKWRMRHAAVTFAEALAGRVADGETWDVLFCSDMLDLATLRGLAHDSIRRLPAVLYFHENQFTYPVRHEDERDWHYGFINITTALAADAVWFNSSFHRQELIEAGTAFLKRMPDYAPFTIMKTIGVKSVVQPPGVCLSRSVNRRDRTQPLSPAKILWAGRWEHDKNPETFFDALRMLVKRRIAFRINVIGEQFRDAPDVFARARDEFGDVIDRWGYMPSRREYEAVLAESDIVVSTAMHEFFGISMVEAILAGCYPLLPDRLSYPELLDVERRPQNKRFLYDGTTGALADRLAELCRRHASAEGVHGENATAVDAVTRFDWTERATVLDNAIAQCATLFGPHF